MDKSEEEALRAEWARAQGMGERLARAASLTAPLAHVFGTHPVRTGPPVGYTHRIPYLFSFS